MQAGNFQTPPRPNRRNDLAEEGVVRQAPHTMVRALDVARKLKSFDHFLYVWGAKGGYFLPPRSALTWHYVSQVLAGEKLLLRADQVGHVQELPRAKGVLIEELWEECRQINSMHAYLPDVTPKTHVPRTYFLNVK